MVSSSILRMSDTTFVARSRLRGKVDYYRARWTRDLNERGGYIVEFLEGPNKGKKYAAINVAIAKLEYR